MFKKTQLYIEKVWKLLVHYLWEDEQEPHSFYYWNLYWLFAFWRHLIQWEKDSYDSWQVSRAYRCFFWLFYDPIIHVKRKNCQEKKNKERRRKKQHEKRSHHLLLFIIIDTMLRYTIISWKRGNCPLSFFLFNINILTGVKLWTITTAYK